MPEMLKTSRDLIKWLVDNLLSRRTDEFGACRMSKHTTFKLKWKRVPRSKTLRTPNPTSSAVTELWIVRKKKFPSPFLLLKSHSMKTQLHLDPIFACAGAAAGATAGAAAGDGGTAAGAAAAGAGAAGRTFGSLSSLGSSTTWRCWGRPNQVIRGTSNSRSLGHQSGHLWWNRLQRQGLFVATPSHLRRWRWRGTDQDFGVQGRWPFRDDDLWAPWDPQKREIYSRYSSHFNGR